MPWNTSSTWHDPKVKNGSALRQETWMEAESLHFRSPMGCLAGAREEPDTHEIPFRRLGLTSHVTQRLLGSWLASLTLLLKTPSPLGKKGSRQLYPDGWERKLPQVHAFVKCFVIHSRLPPLGELAGPGPALPPHPHPRLAASP